MPFLLSSFLELSSASTSISMYRYLRCATKRRLCLLSNVQKVDENMGRAQQRDAAMSGKFYFRKDVYPPIRSGSSSNASSSGSNSPVDGVRKKDKKLRNCFDPLPLPENGVSHRGPVEDEYEEMTLNEIMNGKGGQFPGLLQLVYAYIDTLDIDEEALNKIEKYLDFIKRRSNGWCLFYRYTFISYE